MKIHEYQARQLLQKYDVPFSRGEAIWKAQDTAAAFRRFANPGCVVKVQVLAGGRGKAGGVKKVATAEEASEFASAFIGKPFSTYQSAGEFQVVKSVLITEDIPIAAEYYLGVAIDRAQRKAVILFSKEGGVEIEEVAQKNPQAIGRIPFSPEALPRREAVFQVIRKDFPESKIADSIAEIAEKIARFFVEKDATVCEINPLVLSSVGRVIALDAKIVFDDNALFRHPEIAALKDPDEEDPREGRAKAIGLSYVSMAGDVGCLVNGAGLAMATMDMIKRAGGEPANFLDVGGSATAEQVREGFKIILQDERVKSILVNIFGGIMKCDVIAEGVIQALREIKRPVPLVVRLEGTRVEEGRGLLKKSELSIISCRTIEEAAQTAVREARAYSKPNVHTYR